MISLRGLAPNLANKSQIEYSAGMFVSWLVLTINYRRCWQLFLIGFDCENLLITIKIIVESNL